MTDNLEKAIHMATDWHAGQKDKAGEPYILHPLRVLMVLLTSGANEAESIAGVLHDVLEDAPTLLARKERRYQILQSFGVEVVNAIEALSIRPGEDYATNYIERVQKNPIAARVKPVDLDDNMNLARLPVVTEKDRARVRDKYAPARAKFDAPRRILGCIQLVP